MKLLLTIPNINLKLGFRDNKYGTIDKVVEGYFGYDSAEAKLIKSAAKGEFNLSFRQRLDNIQYKGDIPEHLCHPKTNLIMNDPITLMDGITYDRNLYIRENNEIHEQISTFKTNVTIMKFIEEFVSNEEKKFQETQSQKETKFKIRGR